MTTISAKQFLAKAKMSVKPILIVKSACREASATAEPSAETKLAAPTENGALALTKEYALPATLTVASAEAAVHATP
jgi:hypothetical protein